LYQVSLWPNGNSSSQGMIRSRGLNSVPKIPLTLGCQKCHFLLETGPDPTQAHFWPAVNKWPIRLWPGYFPTRPEAIFFDRKRKKLKNLTFLGELFEIQTQTINGWPNPTRPEPQKIYPTQVKNFWPGPITTSFIINNQTKIFMLLFFLIHYMTSKSCEIFPHYYFETTRAEYFSKKISSKRHFFSSNKH